MRPGGKLSGEQRDGSPSWVEKRTLRVGVIESWKKRARGG